MVEQADQLGFPLIQLPRDASFNEILNPILGEILNRQATVLRRSQEAHRSFTDVMLKGGSLHDIADVLSTFQGGPISIHNPKFRLLALGRPAQGEAAHHRAVARACRGTAILSDSLASVSGPLRLTFEEREFDVYVHPIVVAGEEQGYLILWPETTRPCEVNVMEQAAMVVALEMVKLRAVAEVERKFLSVFVDEIIQGKVTSRNDVISRGEMHGHDLSRTFVPVLIEAGDYRTLPATDRASYARLLRHLWDALAAWTSSLAGTVVVDTGARVLVLNPCDPATSTATAASSARRLIEKVQEGMAVVKGGVVSAGIGRRFGDIMTIKTALFQATQALEIGRVLHGLGSITHYDDLGAYRILMSDLGNPELRRFCHEVLGKLLESDRIHGTELVPTVEVLLRCGFNLRDAARALFVHYNTVRYRVARVREVTGMDLGSPDIQFNLQLAFRILKVPGLMDTPEASLPPHE
jgi:purine catabolism regulator